MPLYVGPLGPYGNTQKARGRRGDPLGGGAKAGLYNFSASRMTKLITDLRAVKAGTGNAILVAEGDSNVWAEGGGDSGLNNRFNAKERAWPTILAKRLASQWGINTTYESMYASGGNVTVTTRADYQNYYKQGFSWTSTGWDFIGATSLGGLMWQNTTDTTSQLVWVTQVACDTMELMFPTVSGNGIMTYSIDGGADVQVNQSGTTANTRLQVALGSVAIHTIVIKRFSGTVFFTGARFWNSTIKQCQVLNVGRSSSTTTDWNTATAAYSARNALQDISSIASGVILCSTINDGLANMADATYNANIQALDVAAAAGGATVMYGTGIPSNLAQVTQAIQDRILNDLKAKAVANNRSMFAWADRNKDWVTMNAAGLIYNQNHPNTAGYLDWGTFVADQIGALV